MAYRGEDLDLRTPQTWSATPAELSSGADASFANGARSGSRTAPLWVDETVLACSNHAFDVALAHRAGEVRIEHLLHALTRVDAAAEALESRGVRVAALRRESATIIASEIPVGLPNGKGAPRRSEDFAQVLRFAAAHAARRGAPASIDDLLNVLFDQRVDHGALGLLSRNMARTYVRDSYEPAPRYMSEARYVPTSDRYSKPPMIDAIRYAPEAPEPRQEFKATPTDALQNSRIEALEKMLRALSTDLSNERQVFSDLLQNLGRETQASRDDQNRLHSSLFDRMSSIENVVTQGAGSGSGEGFGEQHLAGIDTVLERRLRDANKNWSGLSDRLESLEQAVRQLAAVRVDGGGAIDLSPLINRLDIIEEAVLSREPGTTSDLADQFREHQREIHAVISANTSRIESMLSGFGSGETDAGPALERLTSLIHVLENQQTALTNLKSDLTSRLSAVEQAVTGEIETAAAKHQAYASDLTDVHEALMKLNQNQHTLAGSIDQWRSESANDVASITNRLVALDRDNEQPIETLNALSAHMDSVNKLMIERYHRRNRFWYWLFGTDDWIGQSWPSQAAAVEAEKARFTAPKAVVESSHNQR